MIERCLTGTQSVFRFRAIRPGFVMALWGALCVALPVNAQTARPLQKGPTSTGTRQSTRHEADRDGAAGRSDARRITGASKASTRGLEKSTNDGQSRPSVWATLGALVLVVGLILLLARLWKKHGPNVGNAIPADVFEILGRRYLNNRQAVYLVRLGSRVLVLGSTANGLRTLSEVTDPVEVDYLAGLCRQEEAETLSHTFRSLFAGRSSESRQKGLSSPVESPPGAASVAEGRTDSIPIEEEARV